MNIILFRSKIFRRKKKKEKVVETIKKHNLINNGDRVVCGVSGGPDSISMLNILKEIKEEKIYDFEIFAAHVNHGLRVESEEEYKFVENYANVNNIIFEGMKIEGYRDNKFTEKKQQYK